MLKRLFRRVAGPVPVGVQRGYTLWAKHYPPKAHNLLMEIEQQAMLSLLPAGLPGKICLDLACGSGRYVRLLRNRQARQVFGVDYSTGMLAHARRAGLGRGLVCSPFWALPFAPAGFDVITCGLAVGHARNLAQILTEAARVLRPGGMMIYSDIHPFGALAGWQRTFTASRGRVFSLEHYPHLYSDHHRACQAAGLTIQTVLEPFAGEQFPKASRRFPLVLVIRAVKPEQTPSRPAMEW